MNRSNVRSSNEEGVQGQVVNVDNYNMALNSNHNMVDERNMMLFDEDDYQDMVESADSGLMLRPESPYSIPERA